MKSFLSRVKGVGTYTKEEALQYSLSGANLRCTGVKWDLRKDEPYSIYDRFQFDVPVQTGWRCMGTLSSAHCGN